MTRKPAIWPGLLMALLIALGVMGSQTGTFDALSKKLSFTSTTNGSTYQLATVTETGGTTVVTRWNPCQTAITYAVNLARLPAAERAGVLAEIKTGVARLAKATGMTYRYKGTTSFVPSKSNLKGQPAEIVIAAAESTDTDLEFGDTALGFGGTVRATWTGTNGNGAAIVRGYVVLSPKGLASLAPGFGAGMTQGNLILHELGHASGLEHAGSPAQIMYAELSQDSPAGYQAGDLAGLAQLGTAAGCIEIPAGAGLADLS